MSNVQSKFEKETDDKLTNDKQFFVYLLQSTSGNTYVGATVDLNRRLRQHNKEIKGGAHATSIKVQQGETWTRVVHVAGFPDWPSALQFEWRWKQISRKYPLKMDPLIRRLNALKDLLALDKPTTKAKLYSEWPSPPEVVLETEEVRTLYE
uniref:GIY-YIG domain-containing protein n=1 Tax=viral metagenome TaxID=1070528 RepID=A0A6C0ITX0_9ZZZZ